MGVRPRKQLRCYARHLQHYLRPSGAAPGRLVQLLVAGWFRKNIRILSMKPNAGLADLESLMGSALRPVIDGPHPWRDAPRLLRHFGDGKHLGKVVLEFENAATARNKAAHLSTGHA